MNAKKMREQLERFYAESFAKGLRIRTTKKNVILYLVQGDVRKVIAKFDLAFAPDGTETTESLAKRMADGCKDAALSHLVAIEMAKMDDAKVEPIVAQTFVRGVEVERAVIDPELKDSLQSFLGQ